jgi:hypothetical protein
MGSFNFQVFPFLFLSTQLLPSRPMSTAIDKSCRAYVNILNSLRTCLVIQILYVYIRINHFNLFMTIFLTCKYTTSVSTSIPDVISTPNQPNRGPIARFTPNFLSFNETQNQHSHFLYFNPYDLSKLEFYTYYFTQMPYNFNVFTKDTWNISSFII